MKSMILLRHQEIRSQFVLNGSQMSGGFSCESCKIGITLKVASRNLEEAPKNATKKRVTRHGIYRFICDNFFGIEA